MTCDITPRDRSQTFLYDVADVWITCHAYAAWTLWLLGYPDQARQISDTAITMAQDLNHPFSYALALSFDAWLHQFCGVIPRTQERAVTAIAFSTEQGFKFWIGWNTVLDGWALAKQGHAQQGIVQMCQGLADWHATGSELGHAYFLTLMAEVQGERGELAEGLHILAEAQAFTGRTHEHWWEAELYRLKGELLLRQVVPDISQAVACFHHALDIARQQNGKSLELRAAKSLSRLWLQQGKCEEAHTLLAPIYNWFSEGFDTADLQDAKALLEALAQGI
jgi:predicted ATPase